MSPVFTPDGSRIAYTVAWPWDTWVVPVLGGEPRLMLANASGLQFIGSSHILFSEIKSGVHMALVTSQESRGGQRDIYVPPHERGMAHRSALSPDGKWVLIVEMDNSGRLPCRLAPFDGSSQGRRVGPQPGMCTEAAWSKDGEWMYFTSDFGGRPHIWRQRFEGGDPKQVTSGLNEEEGIVLTPDGRSLITSVGQTQSEVWLHDRTGERRVSSEGFGSKVSVSGDGRRIYYMNRTSHDFNRLGFDAGELWVADLESKTNERLFPGVLIIGYSVSADGKRILYSLGKADQTSEIWLASAQRRFPARKLSTGDDSFPNFGGTDDVYFMSAEGKVNYLNRVKEDGSGRQRVSDRPILGLERVSPDGKWAAVWGALPDVESSAGILLYPTDGRKPIKLCTHCRVTWASSAQNIYLSFERMPGEKGRTFVIPFQGSLPEIFTTKGVNTAEDLKDIPGLRTIENAEVAPGPDAETYAFRKTSVHRNIYRVPLP